MKTEASIAYHQVLRSLNRVTDGDLNALRKAIVATGHDHPQRRQAAFVGLVALDRIDEFESARDWNGVRPDISARYVVTTNLAMLRLILQHWKRAGALFLSAFHPNDDPPWEALCILADEYPGPREEAIRYFEARPDARPKVNELRFLARVRPGSGLLLGKCMKALEIGEERRNMSGGESIAAAAILGLQFSQDEEVYERIVADFTGPWFPYRAVMALCEGWPDSPELDPIYNPRIMEAGYDLVTLASVVRLYCLKATSEEIEKTIGRFLSNLGISRFHEVVVLPIVKRLRSDDQLAAWLTARLSDYPSPTEKTTLPRLLASSREMSPDLRSCCLAEIDRQAVTGTHFEIGFDLITGANRAVCTN